MRKKQYKIFAAIHLGSEMISMQIVQYRNLNNMKVLEECNRRVRLGEETFKNKIIPFSMVNEICELLVGFKRLMTEYEVEEYSMQATTAVREALNRVFLLDQIYIRTGLKVTVIDLPEEIYTKYASIRRTMKLDGLTGVDESMLMMDISSGGLGITFVKDNIIRYQQNLNIGVIRVKESFNRNQRSSMKFNQALAEYLSSTMGAVRDALKNEQIHYLVLTGAESELLLQMMGVEFKAGVIRIKTEQFMQLFKTVHELNLPQIIKVFKINEDVAELVVPTILLYEQLLALVPVQEIILTDDRFIDGICLLHIGPKASKDYADELEQEQLSLLYSIGERYQYDEAHSRQVAKLALAMFDKLGKHHGLDSHSRILLQATALLHDIAKELPRDRLLQIFTENAIIAGNAAQRPAPVWHGAAAAILAQTQYGVDDGEILSAIRCHTTGRPGMTKLDKIIYLADMASYERTYPEAEQLRRHALADLDRTAIEGLGLSIAWLKAGGKPVDEESLLAYADLRARYYGGRTSEQTAGEP